MTTCQYCQAPLSSAATRFCTNCGAEVARSPVGQDESQDENQGQEVGPDPNQETMTFWRDAGLTPDAQYLDAQYLDSQDVDVRPTDTETTVVGPALAPPAPDGYGSPTGGPGDPEPGRPGGGRRWMLVAAGVLVLLAAGLAVLLTRGTSGHPAAARPGARSNSATATPTAGSPTAAPTGSATGSALATASGGIAPSLSGSASPSAVSPSPSPSPTDPAGVVTAYYSAIDQHDYRAAWQLGGDHLGESYSSFVSGFSGTAQDTVTVTGVSGDTAEVTLVAQNSDGSTADYSGHYTVQNGVITGANLEPSG